MSDARSFWDREIAEQQHVSWLEDPIIHEYANTCIGGDRAMWPMDWFEEWLGGRRFGRALSIGCGGGALERDLMRRGLCRSVDAFDGSVASLHLARRTAASEGMLDRIRYFAADFNRPAFPRALYDAVFFHQSAHHVAKLEALYRAVLRALKPGGLVYLDEYVGPSRFDWSDRLLAKQRSVYGALASELRSWPAVPYPIQADDPSEAYRSSEIESQLAVGFEIVARRPYGGTLLSVIYPGLRREALTSEIVRQLITEERALLSSGLPSFYTVTAARPRRGLPGAIARLYYALAPAFVLFRLARMKDRLRTKLRGFRRKDSP
jgi:SAM-dependent methyltransferase